MLQPRLLDENFAITLFLVESVQVVGEQLRICKCKSFSITVYSCSSSATASEWGERENLEGLSIQVLELPFLFLSQRDEKLNAHKQSLLETYYPWDDMQISHQGEIIFSVKICSVSVLSWVLFCPNTTSTRMMIVLLFLLSLLDSR